MAKPTDSVVSDGEVLTPKGTIKRLKPDTVPDYIAKEDVTTLSMNVAHWTEELQPLYNKRALLQKDLSEVDNQMTLIRAHLTRLAFRIKEIQQDLA